MASVTRAAVAILSPRSAIKLMVLRTTSSKKHRTMFFASFLSIVFLVAETMKSLFDGEFLVAGTMDSLLIDEFLPVTIGVFTFPIFAFFSHDRNVDSGKFISRATAVCFSPAKMRWIAIRFVSSVIVCIISRSTQTVYTHTICATATY